MFPDLRDNLYTASIEWMILNNGSEWVWKEKVVAQLKLLSHYLGARGSVLGSGTMLQTGRSPVQVPDKVDFFNPSNRTMALGSTQPLTEMSTRNLPGG
jgi:hypothetical protein